MKGIAWDSWCWWQKLEIVGCGVLQVRPSLNCNTMVTLHAMPPFCKHGMHLALLVFIST